MGVVPPEPGFLEALRALCDASGALLVFDEVITGFRVARGGAQERFGVLARPDILGKIVGGGLPLAAFGGRAEMMERLAPGRRRVPGGDAVREPARDRGRPVGAAAAARPGRVRRARAAGARLEAGLAPFGRVQRVGAMLTLFMRGRAGPRLRGRAARATPSATARSSATCSSAAIYVAPSQFEAMFVSLAHGDEEIDRTVEAVGELLRSLSSGTTIAAGAARESPLWAAALRPTRARSGAGLLAARASSDFALGLETIYEGYLAPLRPRRGSSRRPTRDTALLLGDYLYAHGLVRIAARHDGPGGRGPRGADLALRAGARRGEERRRSGLGGERRVPRRRRAGRGADDLPRGGEHRSAARHRAGGGRGARSRARAAGPPGAGRVKVPAMLRLLFEVIPADEEGKRIVIAMLIVGLIFIAVIAIGQSMKWLGHRREERKRRQPQY